MNDSFFLQAENILFTVALVCYVLAMFIYFFVFANQNDKWARIAIAIVAVGFVAHTVAIFARGIGAQRVPLSNQYEYATGFSWGIALFFLIFQKKYNYRSIGTFVVPIIVLIIGYAALLNKEVRPLMPALQSGWLVVHVSMAIIGYGSFGVACGVAAMYIAKEKGGGKIAHGLPDLPILDTISYKAIVIGYLFLTLCIITGALWAQKSWGRFWAWDPKETWSLITWFIYTAYLHMRRTRNMRGHKAAWFAVFGFIAVIFTYIGVNTLLPSLHSYA